MATSIEINSDATVPAGSSITVFLYEDTDGDGVPENTWEQSIGDGTNTYALSGQADDSAGNDWWFYVQRTQTDEGVQPQVHSLNVDVQVTPVDLAADGAASGTGSAIISRARNFFADGNASGTGGGGLSAAFGFNADGSTSGAGTVTVTRSRNFFADGAADGQGAGRLVRTRSFFADGQGDSTGAATLSPARGFSADGSATGTGSAVMNATKRFVVGIKNSIEDKLQFGTR